ncbi:DNA-binding response regulator [Leptothermofonsia sichuanensis E412]|uniref:DNA-binding response regulator n=1 Tax=Leptothermofonsia sichuanensis TaxID=2917832 RepID=UPI001CA6FE52|nr:DNA-binding response regulator [Leptothermofonsia sichuanensis]QZZ21749.1 DNA-binding response regulator [Leptothermofonsia sichuanensis E412]
MTPEQQQEILRLRNLNLSPKQIARQLGIKSAEVTVVIRSQAEAQAVARAERGELAPLERCLINENAARHFFDTSKAGWFGRRKSDPLESDGVGGLAEIFVTRIERNQYLVGSYLVDYWCLGVKDTFGPRKMDRIKYEALIQKAYAGFSQRYREITLEQAQAVIFGAVDYAARFGLKPHRDFEQTKAHLGPRLETLMELEFGKDGKPFYISGPYDNADRIISTLREHAGEGNFDYLMGLGPELDW